MQHSAIHNPHATSTPSERLFAAQRRIRQERLERAAELYSVFGGKIAEKPKVVESPKEWLQRQINIALPPIDPAKIAAVKAANDPSCPVARRPMVYDVQIAACHHFNVTVGDLISKSRMKHLAVPRHYALYLAHELCGRSMPDLGRRFGNRDHTTILHSVHKIRDLRKVDSQVDTIVRALTAVVEERTQ